MYFFHKEVIKEENHQTIGIHYNNKQLPKSK